MTSTPCAPSLAIDPIEASIQPSPAYDGMTTESHGADAAALLLKM